ncbi:O-antigen ligase family protein [Rhodospirillaceae bacterium SYSU D60014]|uniref:O-antigen ligase family protein n=1 Tax=Virgifigura deserti TaxID=2268457 RepID=UPI0013C47FD3
MALTNRPGAALATLALALAPVAIFASKGTVVILAVTGLVLALSQAQRRNALQALATPLSLALVAFLLWAALSSAWAPDPMRSITLVARCTLLFAAGLVCVTAAARMTLSERQVAVCGVALGGAIMLLLLAIETVSDAALTRLVRGMDMETLIARKNGAPLSYGATLLTVFCWPALLAVARLKGHRLALLLFLPIPLVLGFQWITASTVAIGFGMAVFLLVYAWPRTTLGLLFGAFAVSIIAAPLLPPILASTANIEANAEYLPLSWQHRIEIWQFAAEKAAERPLAGWGFDATRVLGRIAESEIFSGGTLALHPHNLSLQLWIELGGIGALLVVGFGFLLFRWLWRNSDDRATAATAAATLTCYLVYAQISRGAWQNWWLATAWLLAVVLLVVAPFRPAGRVNEPSLWRSTA